MRTVIYARFSSDLQNDRSIDDQVADCRARCDREGWTVVDIFTDYAVSGGAGLAESQRPGINALLERVKAGDVDQLLADTPSRVARDQGDAHLVRKLLEYHGARLFTLSQGEIDRYKGTITGLIDEQQRADTAHNIRRGQRGRALAGMNPGGMAYGYRKVPRLDAKGEAVHGLREIDPDQAAVIVAIFEQFARGAGARAICGRLNARGIPSPSGRAWRMTTILGDPKRRNGVLRNDLYRGRIVYNRTRKVQHPLTRKKTIRVNPESEWTVVDAPELRIVSDDLWEAAHRQLRRYSGAIARAGVRPRERRPRRLLSGKAYCGTCGASWRVVQGGGKWSGRWGCAAHHDGRGCSNGRTITTESFEKRVLKGLSERLIDPELFAAYADEYRRTWAEQAKSGRRDRSRLERKKADAEARIARFVAAIGDGRLDAADAGEAIREAKLEKARCEAELAELAAERVVALHPGLADQYRRRCEALLEALGRDDAEAEREAIRALIDRIVVSPRMRVTVGEDGTRREEPAMGTAIEVHGLLSGIVAVAGLKMPDTFAPSSPGRGAAKCTVPLVPLGGIGRSRTLLRIAC